MKGRPWRGAPHGGNPDWVAGPGASGVLWTKAPRRTRGFVQSSCLSAQRGAAPHFYGAKNKNSGMSSAGPLLMREILGEGTGWSGLSRSLQDVQRVGEREW